MFLVKKLVGPIFFPLTLPLGMSVLGLLLLWFTRRQKLGRCLATAGVLALGLLSYHPLPRALLEPLEYAYPAYLPAGQTPGGKRAPKWVVVLGGGYTYDERVSVVSRLSESSLFRVAEGVRIHRALPESKLIFSGGKVYNPVSVGRGMTQVAVSLGVDEKDIVIEDASLDTKDQAVLIKQIVGDEPFVLITSASHMRRAMALFQGQGMSPVAAPAGHKVKAEPVTRVRNWYPTATSMQNAEEAVYEYLGLAWASLRGQTKGKP